MITIFPAGEMVNRLILKISRYFFLVLFLGYLTSITFFTHRHVIDGYKIVHSHPFKSSGHGIPMHNHSVNEFILIHFLTGFLAVVLSFLLANQLLIIPLRRFRKICSNYFFNQQYLNPNSLRGPPEI